MSDRLRVVIATPLSEELVAYVAEAEPRLEVVYEPELLAPADIDWMLPHTPRRRDAGALRGARRHRRGALRGARPLGQGARPHGRGQSAACAGCTRFRRAAGSRSGRPSSTPRRSSASRSRPPPGVHAVPLAEFAVFGVLAGVKRMPWLEGMQDRKQWGPREPLGLLRETTVLVVGLGSDRQADGAAALPDRVPGHRRAPPRGGCPGLSRVVPVEGFADAARDADAIVLALPGTEQTAGMLEPRGARRREAGRSRSSTSGAARQSTSPLSSRRCRTAGSGSPCSTSSRSSRCRRTARSGRCRTCWSRRTPPRSARTSRA